MKWRVYLKRGSSEPPPQSLNLGEVAYRADTQKLLIGDPSAPKGYIEGATVIVAESGQLFAKLPNDKHCIPLYIRVRS